MKITMAFVAFASYSNKIIISALPTSKSDQPLNYIFVVTDGMGPAYLNLARIMKAHVNNGDTVDDPYPNVKLAMDPYLVGQHQSRSYNSYITDSSAAATAFSTGQRINNGWLGVDPEGKNLGNIFGAAKNQKKAKIGCVAKSQITAATPASFYGHAKNRDNQFLIADQSLSFEVDVLLGGGLSQYRYTNRPESYTSSEYAVYPEADIIPNFIDLGYNIAYTKEDLLSLDASSGNRILGLFAEGNMLSAIDSKSKINNTEPDFVEMTRFGLESLKAMADKDGVTFMMTVEASLIDNAGHLNDATTAWQEILNYEKVWEYLTKFVDENPNTVLVATSDHETGGMTIGSRWGEDPDADNYSVVDPSQLMNQTVSFESIVLVAMEHEYKNNPPTDAEVLAYSNEIVAEYLKIDPTTLTEAEQEGLLEGFMPTSESDPFFNISVGLSGVVSRRARIGWTTTEHTATDINIYAYPPTHDVFDNIRGVIDNFDLGLWAANVFGLNLEEETLKVENIQNGPEYEI
eukprot:Awhi_evm1s13037